MSIGTQQPITDDEVERVAAFLHASYGHWLATPDGAGERFNHVRYRYGPYERFEEVSVTTRSKMLFVARDLLTHLRAGTL